MPNQLQQRLNRLIFGVRTSKSAREQPQETPDVPQEEPEHKMDDIDRECYCDGAGDA